ncbi:MAG: methylmalonyl-CoA epimerase [Bacteroidetes bacterium]|nr:methylmalonyl-CoA epimerase [Bacteroidota bacterium]
MKQIDHIGVAVKDLKASEALFTAMIGEEPFYTETVESQNLTVSFFQIGSTKVELLYPLSEKGGVHKFLEKRGEGIHHVAFAVEDIYAEIERMKAEGFQPLSDKPFVGAMNKLVIFFHPKTTNGVLTELCQKQEDYNDSQTAENS